MMNKEQQEQVEQLRQQFIANCSKYAGSGSGNLCSFKIQRSPNPDDTSVTVVWNQITGIDDNMIPETDLVFYNINQEGNVINLALVLNFAHLNDYTSKLVDYE